MLILCIAMPQPRACLADEGHYRIVALYFDVGLRTPLGLPFLPSIRGLQQAKTRGTPQGPPFMNITFPYWSRQIRD
jgi:hypothetical protein